MALAAVIVLGCRLLQPESTRGLSRERRELLADLGPFRPIEGRLAGLAYAVKPVVGTTIPRRAYAAARRLAGVSPSTAARRGDLAFVDLLSGRVEAAVPELEAATRRSPRDALLLSDLGAAYLARGAGRHEPYDYELALGVTGRAVACDPGLLEARFNRALALESFGLVNQARDAWRRYLQQDPRSGWALEAGQHLVSLAVEPESVAWPGAEKELLAAAAASDQPRVVALVARWRRQARRLVEEDLLGRWGNAWLSRQPSEAARVLGMARSISWALVRVEGDGLASGAVATIDRASQPWSPTTLDQLARGHATVSEALAQKGQESSAQSNFRKGAERLASAGSPFQGFARLKAALSLHYLGRELDALAELDPLERSVDARRYPNLAANVAWVTGLAHLKLAHFTTASRLYRRALRLFDRSGEQESLAALHFLLGESLRLQGELPEAWRQRWEALSLARGLDLSPWYHNALFDASEAALGQGEPRVALVFQDEMVAQARHTRDPIDVVESLLRRSRSFIALGEHEAASRDLRAAAAWCDRMTKGALRDSLTADVAMMSAELLIGVDARTAAHKFGEVITFQSARGDRLRLPELHREQALAYRVLGDTSQAMASLVAGIDEAEATGRDLADGQLSGTYFDQVRLLYDEMIRLLIDVRQPEEAFCFVERSRATVLFTNSDQAGAGALPAAEKSECASSGKQHLTDFVRRRLPRQVGMLVFAVLPDRVLAWCLTAEQTSFASLGSPAALTARVRMLRERVPSGRWEARDARAAADLYRLLIEPFHLQLAGKTTLAVIPDRELFEVPFAALVDPATGRFLVEDRAIAYALSASFFLEAGERAAALDRAASRPETAVVVGDPAFDTSLFPDLARLPQADSEARAVAALYPGAELLVGRQATRNAVLRALTRVAVVHLAGHSRIDGNSPLLSGFVLAPEDAARHGGDRGFLDAAEIYRLRVLAARTVVLGACNTADGRITASEGPASLVRPFLAAGVPAVVGSLWPVDDAAGEQLMLVLHSHLRRGEGAADALRAAQLSFLASSDTKLRNPALWAGFEATGAILPRGVSPGR